MRGKAPFAWFGGKYYLAERIVSLLPAHEVYVEVFGGAAQVLFAKPPHISKLEVYNDIDSGLVNFFRVLRDPKMAEELIRRAKLMPYSREEYYYCLETWDEQDDDIERALRWFVVARMSFGGMFGRSWGFAVSGGANGGLVVARWLAAVDKVLAAAAERLRRVQVEHRDFREIFPIYDSTNTLFYVDPPYVRDTWGGTAPVYAHIMSDAEHEELVGILTRLQGVAIVSAYEHPIYNVLTEQYGWSKRTYTQPVRALGRTRRSGLRGGKLLEKHYRTEVLYLSPGVASINALPLFAGLGEEKNGAQEK